MIKRSIIVSILLIICPHSYPGAFGVGSFENDDAYVLLELLQEESDMKFMAVLFAKIANSKDYLEVPDCSIAIAAAEVVAAANGKPTDGLPPEVLKWASGEHIVATKKIKSLANSAIEKCKTYKESELRELWAESDYFEEWKSAISGLSERLQ